MGTCNVYITSGRRNCDSDVRNRMSNFNIRVYRYMENTNVIWSNTDRQNRIFGLFKRNIFCCLYFCSRQTESPMDRNIFLPLQITRIVTWLFVYTYKILLRGEQEIPRVLSSLSIVSIRPRGSLASSNADFRGQSFPLTTRPDKRRRLHIYTL
jgi:hypothetical protein